MNFSLLVTVLRNGRTKYIVAIGLISVLSMPPIVMNSAKTLGRWSNAISHVSVMVGPLTARSGATA